jgi:hypothetical protein
VTDTEPSEQTQAKFAHFIVYAVCDDMQRIAGVKNEATDRRNASTARCAAR